MTEHQSTPAGDSRAHLLRSMARLPGTTSEQRHALMLGARCIETAFSPPSPKPSRPPDYYACTPVWDYRPGDPGDPQIVNAAILTCAATGRVLSGNGGGALAIHPSVIGKPGGAA